MYIHKSKNIVAKKLNGDEPNLTMKINTIWPTKVHTVEKCQLHTYYCCQTTHQEILHCLTHWNLPYALFKWHYKVQIVMDNHHKIQTGALQVITSLASNHEYDQTSPEQWHVHVF